MKKYVVYQCANCGLPQYGRNDRKSRQCVKCTFINHMNFNKIKVILQTDCVREAFEAVAYAKMHREVFIQRLGTHTRTRTSFIRRVNRK